jgi:ABC-type glutathione transport system ATPase component
MTMEVLQESASEGPVIELRGVGLTYPGPPPVTALRGADLVVDHGEYVSVVGPSGSGKSTFLNILGLLDRPTEGSYHFEGWDVGALTESDRTRRTRCCGSAWATGRTRSPPTCPVVSANASRSPAPW